MFVRRFLSSNYQTNTIHIKQIVGKDGKGKGKGSDGAKIYGIDGSYKGKSKGSKGSMDKLSSTKMQYENNVDAYYYYHGYGPYYEDHYHDYGYYHPEDYYDDDHYYYYFDKGGKGKGSSFKGALFKGKGTTYKGKGTSYKGKGASYKGKTLQVSVYLWSRTRQLKLCF